MRNIERGREQRKEGRTEEESKRDGGKVGERTWKQEEVGGKVGIKS